MAKSDSGLYFTLGKKKWTRPQNRTSDVGALFIPAFPDVDLSNKQLEYYITDNTEEREVNPPKILSKTPETKMEKPSKNNTARRKVSQSLDVSSDPNGNGFCKKAPHENADSHMQWWLNDAKTQTYNYEEFSSSRRSSLPSIEDTSVPRGCLFIAGYPTVNEEEVVEVLWIQFTRWGSVDNIKLTSTTSGVPFGFVYFKEYQSAENFLKNSDKVFIGRSLLRVEDAKVNRTFYVAHPQGSKIQGQVLSLQLQRYGSLASFEFEENVKLSSPDCDGSWLVRFNEWESAIAAFNWLRSVGNWFVEWGARVGQSGQTIIYNLVYIDGLDSKIVDRRMVNSMFEQYGEIHNSNLVPRGTNSFAFVEYCNPLSSFRAIRSCHEMVWLNQPIRVQHYRRPSTRNSSALE